MNKDAIIIVDAFLNFDYKIETFRQTLASIKKLNLPLLVISNHKVPEEFVKEFDFFIYSKENLLFTDSYDRYPYVMFFLETESIRYENHTNCYQKHGLSVMSNLKKCTDFATSLGFKKFIRIEWDFIINECDVLKINNLITDFINNDKRAFFVYDPKNANGLPNLAYHFWMVDLNFWNNNFPSIHNEINYKRYIYEKNNENFFEIAERILYMCIFDKLKHDEFILEKDFYKLFKESKINHIINDINFDPPSNNGVCRGFAKVVRNNIQTGELAIFSWNRFLNKEDIKNYQISFDDHNLNYTHTVGFECWMYSLINDFSASKFPITLKMNNEFCKKYDNFDQINSILYIK